MIVRELISRFGFKVDKQGFQKAESGFSKLKKVAGALVAVLVAGKLAMTIRNIATETAALGDRIDKVSEKLGVNAQALQELRFAAKQTGVAQNTLDMAMQRFARRTAEAGRGTGAAKDALAELGVKLKDSTGKLRPVEELLGDVAEGLRKTKGDGDRLRLAFKLFDSEGAALVTTLKGGRGALEDLRRKARETGGVLNDELIAASVEYTDTQHEMSLVVRGFKNLLAKHLLPVFTKSAKGITAWAQANRKWISQKIETVFKAIGRAIEFVRRVLKPIVFLIGSLVSGIIDLTKNLYDANPAIFKFSVLMAVLAAAVLLPISPLILWGILLALVLEDFTLWWEEGDKANTIMGRLDKTLGGVLGVMKDMVKAGEPLNLLGTAFASWAGQAERLAVAIRDATKGLVDLTSGGKLGKFLTFVDAAPIEETEEEKRETIKGRQEVQKLKAKYLAGIRKAKELAKAGRLVAKPSEIGSATAVPPALGSDETVTAPPTMATSALRTAGAFAPSTSIEVNVSAMSNWDPAQVGNVIGEAIDEKLVGTYRQAARAHSQGTP